MLKPDWQHERFTVPAAQVTDKTRDAIRQAMVLHGVHLQLLNGSGGELLVDVVAPPAALAGCQAFLRGQAR